MSIRKLLLISGIASALLYIAADIICGLTYPGYSFTNQVISELSAVGAPTAGLWSAFMIAYAICFALFVIGVLRVAGTNRRLLITGELLAVFLISAPLWAFVPMHQRGAAFTWTDAGHIVMGAFAVLMMMAVIAAGKGSLGASFRRFSRVSLTLSAATGLATFAYIPRMLHGQSSPGVGIVERVSLYVFMLWVAVLAGALTSGRVDQRFGRQRGRVPTTSSGIESPPMVGLT